MEEFDPDEYYRQYEAAGSVNNWRRIDYAARKDEINAQKRAAYKARKSFHDISMENVASTKEAVQSVKSFACDTLDKTAQNQLKNAHKRLLVEGAAQELGVEVGRVFDTSMKPLSKTIVGIDGQIDLPDQNVPYILAHTHPDCNIFSPADLDRFVSRKNVQMMTAICHNGNVLSDLNESKVLLKKQYDNNEITGRELIESIDYLVRMCLDELQGYGVKFYE